jgi:hypothetical protein
MKLTKSQLREIIREELQRIDEAKEFKTIGNLLKILKTDRKFDKYYTKDAFNFIWDIPKADFKKLDISINDLKKLSKTMDAGDGEIDFMFYGMDSDSVSIYIYDKVKPE